MPLTIAICDDNKAQLKELNRLLEKWSVGKPFVLAIDEYISAENFLFDYSDKPCDILLLDIEMNGINGMELAKNLRAKNDTLPIVFITGYSEYISQGYDVEALHYLLKPVNENKLFAVLDKFTKRNVTAEQIILLCGDKTVRISPNSITHIEAQGRKTEVYLSDGRLLDCSMSISSFADMALQGFVRCHRSYIVNLRYVRSITKTDIIFDNDTTVPISRRLYNEVNTQFIKFYTGEK